MLALQYRKSILRYAWVRLMGQRAPGIVTRTGSLLRLANVPEPELPGAAWVRVRPILSGICGSDLAVLSGKASIYLSAFTSFPFIPGHEVVGVVSETGAAVDTLQVGQRVVLEPALSCEVRGIEPLCRPCLEGHYGNCEKATSGDLAAGIQTGFCRDTGGGWGTSLVAHQHQLHSVPEALPNEAAVLVEPFACALHGALLADLSAGSLVLVAGCGSMGLLTIAALRAVGMPCTLVAMGRYSYQRELASSLGADHTVSADDNGYQALAKLTGSSLHPLPLGKPAVVGGFDATFDCVGSARSLEDSVRWTRSQGKVIMVGMPGNEKMDLTPSWYQEVRLMGAYTYGVEDLGGRQLRTFEVALDVLSREGWSRALAGLVRHIYPLREYRKAISTAMRPGRFNAVKTVFDLSGKLPPRQTPQRS